MENDKLTEVDKLVKKALSEPKLLFHNGGTKMFLQNGKLENEPRASLKRLITNYLEDCDTYLNFKKKMEEASRPYKRQKMVNGEIVTYIDYEEWEKHDPIGSWDYGMCEFNGFNSLDMQQWDIDLKIAHIYARKGIEILAEKEI